MKNRFHAPRARIAAIAVALAGSSQGISRAAFDAFLRFQEPLPGMAAVPGASFDQQFPGNQGWFPIASLENGIENQWQWMAGEPFANGGRFRPLEFRKSVEKSSPALYQASTMGGYYGRAELTLRQAGGDVAQAPFYSAIFKNIFITSLDWSWDGGDAPLETVASEFEAMQWTYTKFDARGRPETSVTVNWNQVTQRGGDGAFPDETAPPTLAYASPHSVTAGGSLTVNPSSGPFAPDGIMNVALVSAGGYTGGISVNSFTGSVQLSGAQPIGGPYAIVIQATAFSGLQTEAGFNLTVTPVIPPFVAGADAVTRTLGRGLKIAPSNLLGNDSAGASFDGLVSAATALGGSVSIEDDRIVYEPPFPDPGTNDSFSYRIRNASGQTAAGAVTIAVGGPNGEPSGNLIIAVGDNGNRLRLAGIPGRTYQLQAAGAVAGPWENFGEPVLADENGSAEWVDSNPESPRFYRAYNVVSQ